MLSIIKKSTEKSTLKAPIILLIRKGIIEKLCQEFRNDNQLYDTIGKKRKSPNSVEQKTTKPLKWIPNWTKQSLTKMTKIFKND